MTTYRKISSQIIIIGSLMLGIAACNKGPDVTPTPMLPQDALPTGTASMVVDNTTFTVPASNNPSFNESKVAEGSLVRFVNDTLYLTTVSNGKALLLTLPGVSAKKGTYSVNLKPNPCLTNFFGALQDFVPFAASTGSINCVISSIDSINNTISASINGSIASNGKNWTIGSALFNKVSIKNFTAANSKSRLSDMILDGNGLPLFRTLGAFSEVRYSNDTLDVFAYDADPIRAGANAIHFKIYLTVNRDGNYTIVYNDSVDLKTNLVAVGRYRNITSIEKEDGFSTRGIVRVRKINGNIRLLSLDIDVVQKERNRPPLRVTTVRPFTVAY